MDLELLSERIKPVLKQYWLPIALALVGLIFFAYGLISLLGSASKNNEIKFEHEDLTSTPIKSGQKSQSLITIDVEGAVVRPGVYKLALNSIIQDVLVASGGLSADANRDYVAKNINLASKLTDGAKIYIPKTDEANYQPSSQVLGIGGGGGGEININMASAESLDSLPGVGPVTAEKIINNRPYGSANDLLDKKVVSAKVFSQIKDRITAY